MKLAFINHGKCSGYECNTEVALWVELDQKLGGWVVPDDEWEDPLYSFISHWQTEANTMCRPCIMRGNTNPRRTYIIDSPNISQAIACLPRQGCTCYFFDLRDVNGAIYTSSTVMYSFDGNPIYINGSGIPDTMRH